MMRETMRDLAWISQGVEALTFGAVVDFGEASERFSNLSTDTL
jgi:hypothetical protein